MSKEKAVVQVLKAAHCGCPQVVFKPIPEVWGYFSVKGGGGIHEFSDSQVSPLAVRRSGLCYCTHSCMALSDCWCSNMLVSMTPDMCSLVPACAVQFGHLFAQGPTREAACRAMVVALRDVRVRGEIHTIIDYAADMLQVRLAEG